MSGEKIDLYARLLKYILRLNELKENKKIDNFRIDSLWKYGISGDLPILLVKIRDSNEIEILEEILKDMKKTTLIIDLASAPGGVDMLAAKKYGVNLIHALALPSKTAPESAGIIIAESIINTLEEVLS